MLSKLFAKKNHSLAIEQLTLPIPRGTSGLPVESQEAESYGYHDLPDSWQQHYWGMMGQEGMKDLSKEMQDALLNWWDVLIPREGESENG